MIELLTAVTYLTILTQAAPQIKTACAQVPKNPYAGQIESEYLEIPGCDGPPGIGTDLIDKLAGSSLSASSTGASPLVLSSAVPDSKSFQNTNESASSSSLYTTNRSTSDLGGNIGQLYKSSITRYGQPLQVPREQTNIVKPTKAPAATTPSQASLPPPHNSYISTAVLESAAREIQEVGAAVWHVGPVGRLVAGMTSRPFGSTPIVVMITNDCAAQDPGQPVNLCGMASLTETNSLAMIVNIDLCMDSGATQAFWGQPQWGTTTGQAQQVDCSEWCDVFSDGTKSGPEGCQAPAATWAVTT